jgi:methionyl-tRNA formyltransferase
MYRLAIAGSTERTTKVAQTLLEDQRFEITLIITPQPRKVGREQKLITNPTHQFAQDQDLPALLVDTKLDELAKQTIEQEFSDQPFDFLLVVDFGYLIPNWLLQLPKIAPLNIHPSALPGWRGSSPGQFVLLNGDQESAVTLMVMNDKMDQGPIITQLPFKVDQNWTQTEYYQHSFELICSKLGDLIEQFAKGHLKAKPQPKASPTPVASLLSKEDAFCDWQAIKQAMINGERATEIERACRAYYPWPKLWTKVLTSQGETRMIIHRCSLNDDNQLQLDEVQLAGKKITPYNEVKTAIKT